MTAPEATPGLALQGASPYLLLLLRGSAPPLRHRLQHLPHLSWPQAYT